MEMKLNYEKWKLSYDEAVIRRDAATTDAERYAFTEQITWLLSIRAHINGKLHRTRARLTWGQLWRWGKLSYEDAIAVAANGGTLVMETNAHDQKLYIGDSWKDFVVEDDRPKVKPGFTRPKFPADPAIAFFAHPHEPTGRVRRAVNAVLDFLGL